MRDYSRFIDEASSYRELKDLLEQMLGRDLTDLEDRKIRWFAGCEYDTIGVFVDLFNELKKGCKTKKSPSAKGL